MTAAAPSLFVSRDEGPLAQAIGRAARSRASAVPPIALVAAGMAPMAAAIVLEGDGAPDWLAVAVVLWMVLLGGMASGWPTRRRWLWAVPPALWAAELGGIVWIAALAGDSSHPAAYALLSAAAYRHYDVVYRLRLQGRTPPAWLNRLAGGWDGRLLVAAALLAAGALPAGFYVAAGLLGAVLVGESVASWLRFVREHETYQDHEEDME